MYRIYDEDDGLNLNNDDLIGDKIFKIFQDLFSENSDDNTSLNIDYYNKTFTKKIWYNEKNC